MRKLQWLGKRKADLDDMGEGSLFRSRPTFLNHVGMYWRYWARYTTRIDWRASAGYRG
jgi:hypothetical protein